MFLLCSRFIFKYKKKAKNTKFAVIFCFSFACLVLVYYSIQVCFVSIFVSLVLLLDVWTNLPFCPFAFISQTHTYYVYSTNNTKSVMMAPTNLLYTRYCPLSIYAVCGVCCKSSTCHTIILLRKWNYMFIFDVG